MPRAIRAVDLFCGCGALTYGLQSTGGIDVVMGVDMEPKCEYPFQVNNESLFRCCEVTEELSEEVAEALNWGGIRLLVGGPPCQPFSTQNNFRALGGDERVGAITAFALIASKVRPDIVMMEEVPLAARHPVFVDALRLLRSAGYRTTTTVVRCDEFGIPTVRRRLILMASLWGEEPPLQPPIFTRPRTVRDAIAHLPALASGERHPTVPYHWARQMSDLNLARIRASPVGTTWLGWPDELLGRSHRSQIQRGRVSFTTQYSRMDWDKPAPTLTSQYMSYTNGAFGHPEQDRGITLLEGMLLNGFPAQYQFRPGAEATEISRMVANAVPPPLAQTIGQRVIEHCNHHL